jgi:hypothetical protein
LRQGASTAQPTATWAYRGKNSVHGLTPPIKQQSHEMLESSPILTANRSYTNSELKEIESIAGLQRGVVFYEITPRNG